MKRASWILAMTVTVISGAGMAQTAGGSRMVTQVPFEFVVGNKIVPAGEWSVQSASIAGQELMIRNYNAKIGMYSTISQNEMKERAASSALVFKRYGDQYFLSEIRLKGSTKTYRLPESKAEAELRAQKVFSEKILLAAVK